MHSQRYSYPYAWWTTLLSILVHSLFNIINTHGLINKHTLLEEFLLYHQLADGKTLYKVIYIPHHLELFLGHHKTFSNNNWPFIINKTILGASIFNISEMYSYWDAIWWMYHCSKQQVFQVYLDKSFYKSDNV